MKQSQLIINTTVNRSTYWHNEYYPYLAPVHSYSHALSLHFNACRDNVHIITHVQHGTTESPLKFWEIGLKKMEYLQAVVQLDFVLKYNILKHCR
jgi:hypothetical protein